MKRVVIVRRGICRTVLLTGRWAIKIPTMRGGTARTPYSRLLWFCHGVLANDTEATWSCMPGVNPVVLRIGVVNIYRRAEPVDEDFDDYDRIPTSPDWPSGDKKPENVGIVGGRVVWIDFEWARCGHPS